MLVNNRKLMEFAGDLGAWSCNRSQHLTHSRSGQKTLESLKMEAGGMDLGGSLIAERLAEILVVAAVRAFVAASPTTSVGWITALADRRIGKALRLLHSDFARGWTAPLLASEVGMSRSAFTQRFTARVGRPPLDYLTHWRMVVAQRKLNVGEAVASVCCGDRLQIAKRLFSRLQAKLWSFTAVWAANDVLPGPWDPLRSRWPIVHRLSSPRDRRRKSRIRECPLCDFLGTKGEH
ncbi:AraC family transcriptional regulator [Mesorhizobium sp. M3A.F.Ca.ET.080.04.2.1]|uniref:AraC family transcriptional regulator n=1 Tax=Mesorhizobium sp. M3A.F.Ca.ET.080.04.2.1 TaxID=2493676 RepID=UPI001FE1AD93|nr:AraC family transcriptional regulator [Mesorhizobium sp. M3A.F.Ca.ET.080.04.2.1]